MRVLVFGPYGGQNLGDEFILHQIMHDLRRMGHEPIATSMDPSATQRTHGLTAWPALDLRRGRRRLLQMLVNVDVVVVGGGEQMFESKWKNPLWGLLPNLAHLMAATSRLGIPVMYWSVGASPTSAIGSWMIQRWVSRARAITVRDERSFERLEALGLGGPNLQLAADPVFELDRTSHDLARDRVRTSLPADGHATEAPVVLVIAANDRRRSLNYTTPLLTGCRLAATSLGGRVLILLTDHQERYDRILLSRPEFQPDEVVQVLPQTEFSAEELTTLFAGVDVVISARMHPLIIAATQGTPWLSLGGNSKLGALGATFEQPPVRVDGSTAVSASKAVEEVFMRIRESLAQGRGRWQEQTDPALAGLRHRAARSRDLFGERFPAARVAERASNGAVGNAISDHHG